MAYETDEQGYRYWSYQSSETAEEQKLPNATLYADYYINPVTVPVYYVTQSGTAFTQVTDEQLGAATAAALSRTIPVVNGDGTALTALDASAAAVNGSAHYRATGVYAFGPDAIGTAC